MTLRLGFLPVAVFAIGDRMVSTLPAVGAPGGAFHVTTRAKK